MLVRGALIAVALVLTGGPALAQTTYGVFCASGRIEIDSRTEEQMSAPSCSCR